LTSEELSHCSGVVVIPTAPDYRDLNLAQSAVVMAYLIYRASERPISPARLEGASHGQVDAAADAFVEVAKRAEFLHTGQEPMARELRALFHRAGLSRRESEFMRSLARRIGAKMR
jgi:tRNA C32,U32 (ribose-2'-O)-methylase TrmJ